MNNSLFLLIFLAAAPCLAHNSAPDKAFHPSTLAGVPFETGKAKVNNLQMDIHSFDFKSGSMLNNLKQQLSGRYTVTQQPNKWGRVLIIAPVQSYQCPSCRPLQKFDPEKLMSLTYVISEISAGSKPMIFGSSAKGLLKISAVSYQGPFLDLLKKDLEPQAVAEYRFAKTYLSNLSTLVNQSLATTSRLVQDELVTKGYKKLPQPKTPESNKSNEEYSSVWQLKNSVIRLSVSKVSTNKSQLQFTEIISR